MNQPQPVNDVLPEDLIDRAYEVMCAELDHWQIVGPFEEAGTKRTFHVAVRREAQEGHAKILPGLAPDPADNSQLRQYFTEHKYAVAYVQWNSLRAVLTDRLTRARLIGIGLPANGCQALPDNNEQQSNG